MYVIHGIKARDFLQALLQQVPVGSKISLEGELTAHFTPKISFSTLEEGIYIRNTLAPRQDFWVFEIDESSLSYLSGELLTQIGIRKHVLHIHIGYAGELIFAAYDKFGEEHVVFKAGLGVGEDFLKKMKQKGVIGEYELISR